mgnify:CR=1 FL=1
MLADSVSFDSVNMDPYFQQYWTQMQQYNAYMQPYNAYMQQNSNNLNDSIFNVANQATPTLIGTQDSSSVAFKQNGITQQAKEKHPGRTALLTTLSLAVGAGICIYSKGKAGTKFFGKERWTSGWNNIKKDWFKIGAKDKNYSKLLKSDKVQEYTIAHKGNAYRIKNGKVIEITTSNKNEIVDRAAIEKWLKDNSITDKLKIDNNKLPKGVSLSYRKTVRDHIFEVENGQVVKIFKKDANGNVSDEVSKKVFKNIMEQNKNDVEEALTLTKNGKLNVQLKDENNLVIGKTYTFVIANMEEVNLQTGESFRNYSGPVELTFKSGMVADTSGNLSVETKVVLDKENGEGNDPLIIDLVNPVWEDINTTVDAEGNGTGDVEFIRKRDFPDEENTVIVHFRGTDKYLDKTTVESDLEGFETDIIILDENNNPITDKFTKVLELEDTDNDYEVKYKLTLTSDYFDEYSGKLYVVVPKDEIKDTASECNDALNAVEDKKYEIPLVDFVKPVWKKEVSDTFSKINRVRDGKDDTVQIKLVAFDKYMDKTNAYGQRLLDNEDIILRKYSMMNKINDLAQEFNYDYHYYKLLINQKIGEKISIKGK